MLGPAVLLFFYHFGPVCPEGLGQMCIRDSYDTLYSHVLRKIRECARAALMDGKAVADRLTNTCEAEQREQREAMERSLTCLLYTSRCV